MLHYRQQLHTYIVNHMVVVSNKLDSKLSFAMMKVIKFNKMIVIDQLSLSFSNL